MAKLTSQVKGMFASPRGEVGTYIPNTKISGASNVGLSHDGQLGVPEYSWALSPMFIMGMTNYDPNYGQPGATVKAVSDGARLVAKDAGLDGRPTGYSVGGTAAS